MKVGIVFHSVCGNTYLMARAFEKALTDLGHSVILSRVADPAWVEKQDVPDGARVVLREMQEVSLASPDLLLDRDLVLMGSPTYFGNVSAQMKTFMDSTGGLWVRGKLIGKTSAAFVSAGNAEGGGDLCLQAIHTYARYMGMAVVPAPVSLVPGENWPALGVIQYSNGKYGETLDPKVARAITNFSAHLSRIGRG
ncbi:MAG: flavodoxin family protein [Elusimicrobia bacterium]|nr:flavodoxin family protein [Elusimicrobiota bacterium]